MNRFISVKAIGVLCFFIISMMNPLFSQGTMGSDSFQEFKNSQGYYISETNGQKDISNYPDATEISNSQEISLSEELLIEGISLSDFGITILENKYSYYRIGNTGKLLVIYPEELIIQLYNKQINDED